MKNTSNKATFILFAVFFVYLAVWVILNLFFPLDHDYFNYFTDTYSIVAAIAGYFGFLAAKKWGGFGSYMGRSVGYLSLGLLAQFLGQVTYAFYFYVLHIENAYPSIGDIFYFGSIPLYIIAIFQLYKVLQIKISSGSITKKIIFVIIPALFLSLSYFIFLRDYEFMLDSFTSYAATFFDFGYPLGDAAFVSLAVAAFLFSTSSLGGKLRNNIMLLFISLVMQFGADFVYLFHTMNETWRPGGLDDLFYLSSYVVMGFTLISIGKAAESLMQNAAS